MAKTSKPARTYTILRTCRTGYGVWFCELTLPNGHTVTGGGYGESGAIYRAYAKARDVRGR